MFAHAEPQNLPSIQSSLANPNPKDKLCDTVCNYAKCRCQTNASWSFVVWCCLVSHMSTVWHCFFDLNWSCPIFAVICFAMHVNFLSLVLLPSYSSFLSPYCFVCVRMLSNPVAKGSGTFSRLDLVEFSTWGLLQVLSMTVHCQPKGTQNWIPIGATEAMEISWKSGDCSDHH